IAVARRVTVAISAAVRTIGAVAVGTRAPGARTRDIAVVVGTAVAAPAADSGFGVGRLRRPVTRTAVGRALVDVIVLLLGHREALGGPATAATGAAATIAIATAIAVAVAEGRNRRDIARLRARAIGIAARRGR